MFRMIQRALSFRVIGTALMTGVIAAILVGLVWQAAAPYVLGVVAVAVYVMAVLNDDLVLTCPACRKRTKVAAERCHHCGQPVKQVAA